MATKGLSEAISRELLKHGPQTSLALAERLNEPCRAITNALSKLRAKGSIKRIATIRHPEFRSSTLAVWRSITDKPPTPPAPKKKCYRVPKNAITKEDLAWMKEQKERAAAKAAFRNAER